MFGLISIFSRNQITFNPNGKLNPLTINVPHHKQTSLTLFIWWGTLVVTELNKWTNSNGEKCVWSVNIYIRYNKIHWNIKCFSFHLYMSLWIRNNSSLNNNSGTQSVIVESTQREGMRSQKFPKIMEMKIFW